MTKIHNLSLVEEPIFIVGPGRSGTTLVRTLLSAHPDIAIAPETHFMKSAKNWKASHNNSENAELFWQEYSESIRFADLDIDEDRCYKVFQDQGTLSFRNLFASILKVYSEKTGKPIVGEKTPGHIHFIKELSEWFPKARFVALQRDPRAVVASQLHTPWVVQELSRPGLFIGKRLQQIAHYANDWNEIYLKIAPNWENDERFLIVQYEKLVSNPFHEMTKVCEFVNEEFVEEMLSNNLNRDVHIPTESSGDKKSNWSDWRKEHHEKSVQPVSADSVEKWKNELSNIEISLIEGFCEKGMMNSGYKRTQSNLNCYIGKSLARLFLSGSKYEEKIRSIIG